MVKQSISFDTIPKELRELHQWVNHQDKHPKNPRSGKNALTNVPSTWGCFEEALEGLEREGCLGMGFVFNNNGIVGIDLDDCRDPQTGEIHTEALKIIEAVNSYTEISPSGTGIHIFTYGNIPTGGRKDSKKQKGFLIEIYQTGRFFTMTGNRYKDYDRLNDGSEASNKLYNELFSIDEHVVHKKVEPSDSDLLRIGLEKDIKLIELWNGNRPNGNESSDDQSLMNKLAYWCGCDRDRMISAFIESQHAAGKDPAHIKKINRKDYLLRTADKAIQLCTSTAAVDNQRFRENRELKMKSNAEINGRVIQMTTKAEFIDPFSNKKRYTYDDMGNGYLFADNYKSICRYSPEAKGWMIYNGKYWEPDKGDLKTKEKAKELAKHNTSLIWDVKDAAAREAYEANAKRLFSNHARDMMIKEAQTEYPIYLSELDKRIELFNCQNGTLDLKTLEFREHRAEDLLSKISGVAYDPQAVCPRWIRFIDEVMESDREKALFLQKALGYSLQGLANEECLFLLNGERTRNGKGTCMATVYKVYGDYGKNAQPEILAAKKNANSANASEDLARLRGARFLNISEPPKNMKLNEALAKTLTGSDTITARFLHQNSFEYKPQFVIFINTNYKPHISDDSIFRSGRIKVIPFNRFFTEDERDKNLKTDLTTPESLSGIFNWMLEGLKIYCEEGLKQPQVIVEAVEAYRKESDNLAQFIDENLVSIPGFKEKTAEAYSRYSTWCRDNGLFPESSQNFIQGLKAKGFEIAHNGHIGNFIRDYKLACYDAI